MTTAPSRDIAGALGGSRLFAQPEHARLVAHWRAFLATSRPILLEIGFDHGRRLTHTAAHHPDWRVAGIEVRRRRVDEAKAWAAEHDLPNLLAWRADARTVLATATPAGSLSVIEALFPDPWVDPAHRITRTLVDASFVADAARALRPGGVLHLATDVDDYAANMREALATEPSLVLDPTAAALRPRCEALSRREWRCAQDNIPIHRFWLRKRG